MTNPKESLESMSKEYADNKKTKKFWNQYYKDYYKNNPEKKEAKRKLDRERQERLRREKGQTPRPEYKDKRRGKK